jgi:DNA-binding NarL/FixJ family response regulator
MEKEVFELAGKDTLGNEEMAKKLFMSAHTIRGHLHSIYEKMGFTGKYARLKLIKHYYIKLMEKNNELIYSEGEGEAL